VCHVRERFFTLIANDEILDFMEIMEINLAQEKVLSEVKNYLAPHEKEAMFILGNLQQEIFAHIYIAKIGDRIVGVCGYYPLFHSCSIFSETTEASILLGRVVKDTYITKALVGMKKIVQPVCDDWVAAGKKLINVPEQDFYELPLDEFVPYPLREGSICEVDESNVCDVVMLQRILHEESLIGAPRTEEKERVLANPIRFGVKTEGKIVSVAISNGLAIHAFQILGVVTDPNFRGRGYARAVCSHLIMNMKEKGAKKAILFTCKNNLSAKKCYQSLGFRITDSYYVSLFQ
jgi:ribosomal protein S18 acetylase RimI-like enzyme